MPAATYTTCSDSTAAVTGHLQLPHVFSWAHRRASHRCVVHSQPTTPRGVFTVGAVRTSAATAVAPARGCTVVSVRMCVCVSVCVCAPRAVQ